MPKLDICISDSQTQASSTELSFRVWWWWQGRVKCPNCNACVGTKSLFYRMKYMKNSVYYINTYAQSF